MPPFRRELSLEHRPKLRRGLRKYIARRVPESHVESVLVHVDVDLQTCEWDHDPPTAKDIRKMAYTIAKRRIIDYWRKQSRQPQDVEDQAELVDKNAHDPVEDAVANEALELAMARYRRALAFALRPDQNCYRGSLGRELHWYDSLLMELREHMPWASTRRLGRTIKTWHQRFHLASSFAHRHETLACARMKIIVAKILQFSASEG